MNIAGARTQVNGFAPKAKKTIMALRHSQNSANPCGSLLHIINDIKALPDENAAVMTFAEFESYNIKQIYIIIDKLLDDTDEISLQLANSSYPSCSSQSNSLPMWSRELKVVIFITSVPSVFSSIPISRITTVISNNLPLFDLRNLNRRQSVLHHLIRP